MFILANTADIGAKVQLENDLSEAALAKGYPVVKSTVIFPPSFRDPRPPSIEQVMDSLKATGCDAFFVINLKRKEDLKFMPGVKVNANSGWIGGLLASSFGHQTNNADVKEVNKPGSNAYKNSFYITGDLGDANTKVIVYSAISEMMEYDKLKTEGKVYLRGLVDMMEKQQILRKRRL